MDKDGSAALYYRGPGEEYSSRRCLEQHFNIDVSPQALRFCVEPEADGIESMDFRFLPGALAETTAYLKIYSVSIEAVDGVSNASIPLVSALSHDQINEHFSLRGLAFNNRILGEMFVVEDEDPALEWRVPHGTQPTAGTRLVFKIVLDYLPDAGYVLARDRFIARQEHYEERVRELESTITELDASRRELERYKGSTLWNKFVRAQQLYDRLAGAAGQGRLRTCLKLFDPGWWSRRDRNEYERWRTANGYRNRPDE